jgi:hypothetical protein
MPLEPGVLPGRCYRRMIPSELDAFDHLLDNSSEAVLARTAASPPDESSRAGRGRGTPDESRTISDSDIGVAAQTTPFV